MLSEQILWLDEASLSAEATVGQRLGAIGKELYISLKYYWKETDEVAKSLADNGNVLEVLLAWLIDDYATNQLPARALADLLVATEALARLSPDAFAATTDPSVWEPMLTDWAQTCEHWAARQAAIRLLGRLRRVTDRVAQAFQAAMNDVSFVQQAAFTAASEFRRVDGDLIPDLLRALDDPSANVAAATARLLAGVARAEGTSAIDCRRILRGLRLAAEKPSATRPVFLMDETDWGLRIRFENRLDRILYRAIFEISGL